MVIISYQSPAKKVDPPQTIFWKNKGVQATSFLLYEGFLEEDDDDDPVDKVVHRRQEYKVVHHQEEEEEEEAVATTEEGDFKEEGKTLKKWSETFPSLVRCLLANNNRTTLGKHHSSRSWETKTAKKYAGLFLDKKYNDLVTNGGYDDFTLSEMSAEEEEEEDTFLFHLEELHKLLQQHKKVDFRRKIPLPDRAKALGEWLEGQVELAQAAELPPSRVHHLVNLGLCWNEDEAVWDGNYKRLLSSYKLLFGKTSARPLLTKDASLKKWIQTQILQGKGLDKERRRLLRSLRRRLAKKLDTYTKMEEWRAFELLCHQVLPGQQHEDDTHLKRKQPIELVQPQAKKRRLLQDLPVSRLCENNTVDQTPIKDTMISKDVSSPCGLPILRLDSEGLSPEPVMMAKQDDPSSDKENGDMDWLFASPLSNKYPGQRQPCFE